MTDGEEFRAYMKAANSTSGNQDDRHLSEAEMIAYCRGELSEAEREAAQAHLVGCEPCIALFRNAGDFLEPARAGEEEVMAAEISQAWQSVLQRVQTASPINAGGAGTTVVQGDFQRPRDRKLFLDSRISLAMAASLMISFGALGWLGWRFWQERQSRRQSQEVAMQLESKQHELEQRLLRLEQSSGDQLKRERDERVAAEKERDQLQALVATAQPARPNIPVFTERLSSERGAEDDLRMHFTRAVKAARLRLIISKPYEFRTYVIQLFDQPGEMVREISGLRPTGDDGALSVLLNRGTLNAGKYRLRLFGQGGETKKQLGEYGLTVTVGR